MNKLWHLYFIQEIGTENIKIGIAAKLTKRLHEIQTDNSNKVRLLGAAKFNSEVAVRRFEKRLHAMFAAQRIRGEWFATSERLMSVALSAC
jgi:Meiotically up-regulated gene 113